MKRKYLLVIEGDSNDADYIEKTTEFTVNDDEAFSGLVQLAKEIRELPKYFMEEMDSLDEEERLDRDALLLYIPKSDYDYVHTITSVKLYEVVPVEF